MTYAIIAIVILALLGYLVRQYNLPKILAERNESIEARSKAQDERRNDAAARKAAQNAEREKRRKEKSDRRNRPR